MVKKHSHLIGWTVVEAEDDPSDVEMDDEFWHEMLDLFFVRGRVSKSREEDDLVFFVNSMVPFSPADVFLMYPDTALLCAIYISPFDGTVC
jgi:hypothetical protein